MQRVGTNKNGGMNEYTTPRKKKKIIAMNALILVACMVDEQTVRVSKRIGMKMGSIYRSKLGNAFGSFMKQSCRLRTGF